MDYDYVQAWNRVVECLLATKRAWEEHTKHAVVDRETMEQLPVDAQRMLGLATNKSSFEVGLPRILDYARIKGGLDELIIKGETQEDTN